MSLGRQVSVRQRLVSALLSTVLALFGVLGTGGAAHAEIIGDISGVVSVPSDSGPVPQGNVYIQLTDADGNTFDSTYSTPGTGDFEFLAVPAGDYRIRYSYPQYLDEFYPGVATLLESTLITVDGSVASPLEIVLTPPSSLTFNFENPDGEVMAETSVYLFDQSGAYVGFGYSDEFGVAQINSLRPGTYYFCQINYQEFPRWIYDCNDHVRTSFSVENGVDVTGLTPVVLAAGESKTIDYRIGQQSKISGRVLNSDGEAITFVGGPDDGESMVVVDLFKWNPDANLYEYSQGVWVNPDGTYEAYVEDGTYQVMFLDRSAPYGYIQDYTQPKHYGTTYYKVAGEVADVVVSDGEVAADIDGTLYELSYLSGRVVQAADNTQGVEGVVVELINGYGQTSGYLRATTDANGDYKLWVAEPGTYTVRFDAQSAGYSLNYYPDQATNSDALQLEIGEAEYLTGINAHLVQGGSISGVLAGTDGLNSYVLADALVFAVDQNDTPYLAWTNESGEYEFLGLPDGSYKIYFAPQDGLHLGRYYGGTPNWSQATIVEISGANDVVGINQAVPLGATLKGRILGENGVGSTVGLSGVNVTLESETGYGYGTATDANGYFEISGIEDTEIYTARSDGGNGNHIGSYYPGVYAYESAASIMLEATKTLTLNDWVLENGGTISGNIWALYQSTPQGVQGSLFLTNLDTGNRYEVYDIGTFGNFSRSGLKPGAYTLDFIPYNGSQWAPIFAKPIGTLAKLSTLTVNENLQVGATISGNLLVANGAGNVPLPGSFVIATLVNDSIEWSRFAFVDEANGDFVLNGLPVGKFRLRFVDDSGQYVSEFWQNASFSDATLVSVDALGQDLTGYDAVLEQAGSISGRLTVDGPYGPVGAPFADVAVLNLLGDIVQFGFTNQAGNYEILGLPAGDYIVVAYPGTPGYQDTFYGDVTRLDFASIVHLDAAQNLTGIDILIQELRLGSISGSVTTEDDPAVAIEGVRVTAYSQSTDVYAEAFTDANGEYTISGLTEASDYYVRFESTGVYRGEWFDNTQNFKLKQKLNIGAGESITGIDAQLTEGAGLILRILGQNAEPVPYLAYACADLSTIYGDWLDGGCADEFGVLRLGGLPAGEVVIDIWNTGGFMGTRLGADGSIVLTKGEILDLGDVTLSVASTISGVVKGQDGASQVPVSASVRFVNEVTKESWFTETDEAGAYTSPALPAGDYSVRIAATFGNSPFVPDLNWKQVSVAPAENKTISNFVLEMGATISGKIRGWDGTQFVTPTSLWAFTDFNAPNLVVERRVNVNADGTYTLRGLLPGNYVIHFGDDDGNFATELYDDAPSYEEANRVLISSLSDQISGVNADLAQSGSISGEITDGNGLSMPWVEVNVFDIDGNNVGWAYTDDYGKYVIGSLKPGQYRVVAYAYDGTHTGTWYVETSKYSQATWVDVVGGQDTPNIDIQLLIGAKISGTVNMASNPEVGISAFVTLLDQYENYVADVIADADGQFAFNAVADGTYFIRAEAALEGYYPAFYSTGGEDKAAITVEAGQVVSGLQILMSLGSTVRGHVSGLRDGKLTDLAGIQISLVDSDGVNTAWAMTDLQGDFTVSGVAPGKYVVQALPSWGDAEGFSLDWLDAVLPADGSTLDLRTPTTINDQNFVLLPGGRITGHVNLPQAIQPDGMWVIAISRTSFFTRSALLDGNGDFKIDGLPADEYFVKVMDWEGRIVGTYYGDVASEGDAKSITLASQQVVSGINITPVKAGTITGVVTGFDGDTAKPLFRVLVSAYDQNGDIESSVFTGRDGSYTLSGLRPGTYKLFFENVNWFYYNGPFSSEWFDNKLTQADATALTLVAGQTLSSKDAVLELNPKTVQLNGKVTLNGTPVQGMANVCVFEAADVETPITCSWVDEADGSYHFLLPGSGSYKISASLMNQSGLVSLGWYTNATSAANAAVLSVTDGQVVTDANVDLQTLNTLQLSSKPKLDGDPKVGETIKVELGDWDAGVTFDYQWSLDGTPIDNATASTYTVKSGDLGHYLSVTVTGQKDGYLPVSKFSASSLIVVGEFNLFAKPTFTGTPKVGDTLTAVVSDWDEGTTLLLRWTRDGADIEGATGATYKLVAADLGHKISVRAIGSKDGFSDKSVESDSESTVGEGELKTTPKPTFTGTVAVGNTLTASIGTWDDGVATSLQWLRDGVAIDGATTVTYVVTVADFGKKLSVKVTGSKTAFAASTATSTEVTVGAAQQTLTGTVAITGTAKVGQVLTGSAGTWDTGTTLAYRWLAGGTAISGATSTSYTLTASEVGKAITFEVSSSKLGYSTKTVVSSATSAVLANITVSTAPKLSGTAKSGSSLSATTGSYKGISSIKYSYKWYRCTSSTTASTTLSSKCVVISKATKSSYKAVTADKGKYLVAGITAKGSAGSITAYTKSSSKTK